MKKREILFEQLWSDLESGAASQDVVIDRALPVGLEGALATASALKDFGRAAPAPDLDGMWQSVSSELEEARPAQSVRPVRLHIKRARWSLRLAAGLAAAVLVLAAVAREAVPGSRLYPVRLTMERVALAFAPNSASLHLRIAEARLQDLLESLHAGPVTAAPGVARALLSSRNAARSEGANVGRLDALIASEVPPALAPIPAVIAQQIRTILGALLPSTPSAPAPASGGAVGSESGTDGPRRGEGTDEGGAGSGEGSMEDQGGSGSEGSGSGSSEGSPSEVGDSGEGSGSGGSGSDEGGDREGSGSPDGSGGSGGD